jgi:LacI family transcriptional regulator
MVSSKDVAKLAGVSQSTVSRVLNNPAGVSKPALEKVKMAMSELNYRPNSVARSLVQKKTKSIALISGPLHNPFFVETTTAIVNYAAKQGYHVNVHFENMGDNMSVYKTVLSHQVDGIILSSIFYEDPVYEELDAMGVPFVMFNRKHQSGGNFVEKDNEQSGKLAMQHLLDLGHQDIAWIGGSLKTSTFYGRHKGYKDTLQKHSIHTPSSFVQITDTSRAGVFEAVSTIMANKTRPTAIFAATDSIANFAMDCLIEKGYSIPDDISLIGMDNVEWSGHQAIQLTTVGPKEGKNLGQLAIEQLMELIHHPEKCKIPIQITVEPELIIRKTTQKL